MSVARELAYPPALCFIVAFAAYLIALWNGDEARADDYAALLSEQSANLSFGYWKIWQRSYSQTLRLRAQVEPAAR